MAKAKQKPIDRLMEAVDRYAEARRQCKRNPCYCLSRHATFRRFAIKLLRESQKPHNRRP